MTIRVKSDEQYINTLLAINKELGDFAKELKKQRDELLAAAEAVEIDAEECMNFDDCTGMFIPIDAYHKLMEAIARVKGEKE